MAFVHLATNLTLIRLCWVPAFSNFQSRDKQNCAIKACFQCIGCRAKANFFSNNFFLNDTKHIKSTCSKSNGIEPLTIIRHQLNKFFDFCACRKMLVRNITQIEAKKLEKEIKQSGRNFERNQALQ